MSAEDNRRTLHRTDPFVNFGYIPRKLCFLFGNIIACNFRSVKLLQIHLIKTDWPGRVKQSAIQILLERNNNTNIHIYVVNYLRKLKLLPIMNDLIRHSAMQHSLNIYIARKIHHR